MIELMGKYGYGIGGGLSDDMVSLKSNPIWNYKNFNVIF